jgi:hypothetical protein
MAMRLTQPRAARRVAVSSLVVLALLSAATVARAAIAFTYFNGTLGAFSAWTTGNQSGNDYRNWSHADKNSGCGNGRLIEAAYVTGVGSQAIISGSVVFGDCTAYQGNASGAFTTAFVAAGCRNANSGSQSLNCSTTRQS